MALRDDGTKRFLLHKTGHMIMSFTETENKRFPVTALVVILQEECKSVFYMLVLDVIKLSK